MAKGTIMTKNVTSFGGSFPLHIYTITENINKRKITSSDTPAPSALKIDKIPKLNLSGFYPSHSINIKTHPIYLTFLSVSLLYLKPTPLIFLYHHKNT